MTDTIYFKISELLLLSRCYIAFMETPCEPLWPTTLLYVSLLFTRRLSGRQHIGVTNMLLKQFPGVHAFH